MDEWVEYSDYTHNLSLWEILHIHEIFPKSFIPGILVGKKNENKITHHNIATILYLACKDKISLINDSH